MGSQALRWFDELHPDAKGGVILLAAALIAMVMSNTPLSGLYGTLLDTPLAIRAGALALEKPLLHWINDGLMAVFFFLVGVEIKREILEGALSSWQQASLPVFAAAGGMIVPALIYAGINAGDVHALRGWAIPSATDIAFAVGVVALLGPRVPAALKIFLLALAIIDDLGAIVIIALFYTDNLSLTSLLLAGSGCIVLAILNRRNVSRLAPYVLTGLFIWVCVLKSGVHATMAGVLVALFIPLRTNEAPSLLDDVEHAVRPWVIYGVAPLFAFANAGIALSGIGAGMLFAPIPLGIALGLVLGKPLGIYLFAMAAVHAGVSGLPDGSNRIQLLGVAMLGGIGFTMSLFIGMLAFPDPADAVAIRIGVLAGSVISALGGYMVLSTASTGAAVKPGTTQS